MSEAPKRIGICPIHKTWHREPHETDWNYIRADLVEATIKRALEKAAAEIGPHPDHDKADWTEYAHHAHRLAQFIRRLDPARFIEEEKG
jgi:hypothetical protein